MTINFTCATMRRRDGEKGNDMSLEISGQHQCVRIYIYVCTYMYI